MNGSALPQIWKTYKTKSVESLNIWREIMLLIGCGFYLIYGIYQRDIVIMISNTWAVSMFITLIIMQLKYKEKK